MTKRRKFLKSGSIGVLSVFAGCINPSNPKNPDNNTSTPTDTPENTKDESDTNNTTDNNTTDDEIPNDTTNEQDKTDVKLTLNNQGASAWVISDVEGGSVGSTGTSNPELKLNNGSRYRVNNDGWSFHPIAFRDSNGNVLLSQSSDGDLQSSEDVNWVDEGEYIEFTVSSEFADRVDEYYCTVHSSMVGGVQI